MPSSDSSAQRRAHLAFLYAVPISLLGGLMGLGGAEFRLPVLAGPLGYAARRAVPLNLAVSLVTLPAPLATRARTLALSSIVQFLPGASGLIGGAVVTAFLGPALASRLSEDRFEQVILIIATALIVGGSLPQQLPALLPSSVFWHVGSGIVFGLAIGLFNSLLGVVGGELIIPTFVFAFGADIKTAGTASLLVSLPTVPVGIACYVSRGTYAEWRDIVETVVPMGLGSVLGALLGGMLVGLVPATALKVTLGIILIFSAIRMFYSKQAAYR